MKLKFENFALTLADTVLRWRFIVIALTFLLVFAAASGMPKLQFANNYRVFFSDNNPELNAFEEFQNTYSKTDNIMFVIKPSEGKVFTPDVMQAVEEITKASWQIPFVLRVDSVTNFQYSWAEGDDLTVDDFIRKADGVSPSDYKVKENIAVNEPLLYRNMIAEDVETTAVNAVFQFPEKELTEVPEAVAKAREIVTQMQQKYPDLTIVLSGASMLNMAFMEAGMADMQTLTPIMYLVLLIIMVVAIRSFSGVVATLVVVLFSMFSAMGLAGYGGIQLTPVSVMAPTIILTLAIADSIHILISMITSMRQGLDKKSAIREAIRVNFMAISITSLTTIIGFLTLNLLDTPPFWHLGNITAAGIFFAWIYSLTFLPALISILPMKVKPKSGKTGLTGLLSRYADFVIAKRKPILVISSLAAITLVAMVPRIEINDQWVKYFDYSIPFRADAEFAMKELGGTYLVEYSIDSGQSGGVSDPEYLKSLEHLTAWLRSQSEVVHVFSLSDIMSRLNKNMHGDAQDWYRIPDDRELSAQYLLLYELSLPYGLDLNDRVNIDKSSSRLTVTLGDMTTQDMKAFIAKTDGWLQENFPENVNAVPTGPTAMFTNITHRNIEGMLKGNALAIVAIALIMMIALRSVGLGALSIIPNAVPILMTFGLWAITFEKIGMASATVSAVALGIVVDDSVHFLAKYVRARREQGLSKPEAIKYAFETVGLALVATTIILTAGFSVMAMSAFQMNSQLGLMTAATMVVALIMDFTLLPALLLIGHKEDEKEQQQETETLHEQPAI
jgi:predicted RND superfamily exporter protein